MGFLENLRLSLSGILSNKMRSFLTMLGIIIGISAVITITTIGNSVSSTLSNTMNKLGGTNYIYLFLEAKYPEDDEAWETWEYPEITSDDTIKEETIDALAEYLGDDYKGVLLSEYGGSGITTNTKNLENYANVEVQGLNDGFCQYLSSAVTLLKGRWITDRDVREKRNVAIVSDTFVKNYFGDESINPIGQNIEVDMNGNMLNFVIVGVYEYSNAYFGKPDTSIPEKDRYTTLWTSVSYANSINPDSETQVEGYTELQINANDGVDMTTFQANVDLFFEDYYADNQNWHTYSYNTSSEMETINMALSIVTLAITIIAGISLIVGGVGVMNIMLVSITERTKEIGIRKALGAKKGSIKGQFITEAIMLCLIGGIIGILSGIINSIVIAQVAKYLLINYYPDEMSLISLTVEPNVLAIIISVIFSMLTGVFFGYYPANKASKMNPIDALRYE
ncbi:MAG: ABC transporter permease [Ruminococcus sp.]|nr:ABC transporter permease [Ruminococcus sp.]